MAVFFNGRLWITPATMSVVDDSAMLNRNLSVGNRLAIIGTSDGGAPNTPIVIGDPTEGRRIVRSDVAAKAIEKAFDPSAQTGGPAEVVFIRVNPAVQAELMLKDGGGADIISLKSSDYGIYTNQIRVKVETGTNAGKKLTTQLGNGYYTADDVARNAFEIEYTGSEATATMTITGTQVELFAPAATSVATIDLAAYDTVEKLVDYINSVPDFAASVLDGNGGRPTLNGLDPIAAQDVVTAYTATANIQAIVDWFNGQAEGFVTAERVSGAGGVPADIPFTYLSGGSNGVTTNSEWSDALQTLQGEDVQWVVALTPDDSIHAMVDTHCAYMSGIGRMERRALHGTASGTSDDDGMLKAKALNSDRSSLIHIGFYDFGPDGKLKLYEPYVLAALCGGALAGSNPGTALTNKTLKVRGLERKLRNPTDTDRLIPAGVFCVEDTPTGFKVVKSITTWLNDTNYNRVEISTGVALDFTSRNVRQAVDVVRGEKGNPITLSRAANLAESALRELSRPEPSGPGVLVGDEENPPYRNIRASLEGDVIRVDFECSPVIPVNYVPVTIYAVPYSGSASI